MKPLRNDQETNYCLNGNLDFKYPDFNLISDVRISPTENLLLVLKSGLTYHEIIGVQRNAGDLVSF